jgi:hypothetical protein
MMQFGATPTQTEVTGGVVVETMRQNMAHSYAVGYAVASLGTLAAFIAARGWMKPNKQPPKDVKPT